MVESSEAFEANALAGEVYKSLFLDEERGKVDFMEQDGKEGDEEEVISQFCVVGRLITDKPFNFIAFKKIMAAVWKPVKGMLMKDLGNNAFLIQFMHRMDMERVVDGGHRNFVQNLIVLVEVPLGTNPKQVPLIKAAYWVQLHDYPTRSRLEHTFYDVGNYIELRAKIHRSSTIGRKWLLMEEEVRNGGRKVDNDSRYWDKQEPIV
ncbi:hypothetical protein K2173_010302 [Erythroxylum novogranatense]|uniref:DUF4283 domain-containing protein n=1 Tax=Erythroxylum novogranatense TaxID=1862640 RepID=A0AAV8TDI1_9ROSI|nr:hypothetical protein K2173_010302 [Erythroxylum novogranatense]